MVSAELLFTTAQMREVDRLAILRGTAGIELMERAGLVTARCAAARLAPGGHVAVLCGPGNNGGDGFVAARALAQHGFRVELALLGERDRLVGDAALAAARWDGPVVAPDAVDLTVVDLIVDALFGAGLVRDLTGTAACVVEKINASGRPVLAVDLPSGVDGDTGRVRGAAVRASETVTFHRRKPGQLLLPGRLHCGLVRLASIGIPSAIDGQALGEAASVFANNAALWDAALPRPAREGHKYGRGHALVLGGGIEGVGAARLAARAALRIGAGLVTLGVPGSALLAHAARGPDALMVRVRDSAGSDLLTDHRINAAVIGPAFGVGEGTREAVRALLQAGKAAVLDADALTSFEGRAGELANLIHGRASFDAQPEGGAAASGGKLENAAGVVLTPHDGEFARLMRGADLATERGESAPRGSKIDRTRLAARFTGAVLVLKGADTVVAAPDGRAAVNESGTPYLATAGSGDALAGAIAGLLAQGMPAFEAACAAVWLHGQAGEALGPGLIADDLPEAMAGAIGRVAEGS